MFDIMYCQQIPYEYRRFNVLYMRLDLPFESEMYVWQGQ